MGPGESHSIGLRFTPQQFPGKAELLIFINDSEDKNEETFCISALYTWQRYVTSFIALCLSPVSPRVSMGFFKSKLKKATFYLEILICHYSDGNENVQKSNRLRLAKKQLGTCSPLFCTFLCRQCTTITWNCLILLFTLGAILTPKRNWRQCLCKILGWQTESIMVSGYVTVFSGVVNFCSGEFAYIISRQRVDSFATYA